MKQDIQNQADAIAEQILKSLSDEDSRKLLPVLIDTLSKKQEELDTTGEVISALKLDKETIRKIEQVVSKKIGHSVTLENKVDKKIVGGIVIRYKDIVIDQSIKRQLTDIQQAVYES